MPTIGNVTVITYTDSGDSPHIADFIHDNDGDDLLVFAIGHDSNLTTATADFSAVYNFATMTPLGETETGHTEEVPRIEAFYVEDAADGPNRCIVTFDVGVVNYQAYIVVAVSVSGVSQIGDLATGRSESNVATITAALDVQESGSLILALGAFKDGFATLTGGAGYTLIGSSITTGAISDKSDFVALLQSLTTTTTGALNADVSTNIDEESSIMAIELRPAAVVPSGPNLTLSESLLLAERPVVLIDLEFDSGSFNFWTRPFSGEKDGTTYFPIAGLTGSLTLRQSLDRPSLDAGAQIVGTSQEIKNAALTEDFQLRPARIHLGNIEDDGDVNSEVLLRGTMQDIPIIIDPDEGLQMSVIVNSIFTDIDTPLDLRLSAADQVEFNPIDSFFDFVEISTEPRFGA